MAALLDDEDSELGIPAGSTKAAGKRDTDEPLSEMEDEDFLAAVKKIWHTDSEHWSEWRDEAKKDFDYRAGHQWDEEDRKKLEDEFRPIVTFNRVGAMVDSVVGLEINNRREVQYLPREQGDAAANEILTGAAEWARDRTNAEMEETDAFGDCVTCGLGWIDNRLEFEDNPAGEFRCDRLNPFEMWPDARARKRNLADARHIWRVRAMSLEDAKALVPGHDDEDYNASWAKSGGVRPSDETPGTARDPGQHYLALNIEDTPADEEDDEVTLVHFKWFERQDYWDIEISGQKLEATQEQYEVLSKRVPELASFNGGPIPFKAVRATRKVYKQAWIGRVLLERSDNDCPTHFGWEALTGKRDQTTGTWYGLVRSMRDPQNWANKWLSQSMHILNSNAKGGYLYESGVFVNPKKAEEDWARPDRNIEVRPGALSAERPKLMPRQPAPFPTGFSDLLQFALSSIRDVSGVNLELLGMADRQQAGVLETERKQAAITILADLFDSLRQYRKRQAEILLYFIQTYLADGRLIRLVGEEGAQYVPLVLDTEAEFDVVVEDAASSPNQRERIWKDLQQVLPVVAGSLGPEDLLVLAEYALPPSVATKLKQNRDQAQQANAEMQQAQQRLAMQQAEAEVAKTQAEAQKIDVDRGKLEIEALKARIALMQAETASGAKATDIDLELQKIEREHALKRDEMVLQHNLKSREMGLPEVDAEGAVVPAPVKQALALIAQQMQDIQAALSAPRQVVRDEAGQVIGAQINGVFMAAERDESGAITGVSPAPPP